MREAKKKKKKKGSEKPCLEAEASLATQWVLGDTQPPQALQPETQTPAGESAGPSQVPGGGRERGNFKGRGSEKGYIRRKTMHAF